MNNYNKTLIYAGLAGIGIYFSYKFFSKSSDNTPVIPVNPINIINTGPVNYPPPVNNVNPPPITSPPITPTPPPSGVVAYFSRSLIVNNIVAYLFGSLNGLSQLLSDSGFPSINNINSQGYDVAQLTINPNTGLMFGPFPSGYYYMPKVNVSLMVGFPLVSTPVTYPPMGTFVGTTPYISPPDGALVGLTAPPNQTWGGQVYTAYPLTGAVPMTGFGSSLGMWLRFSVCAWNIVSVSPITYPTAIPWTLNSDSGTQVIWAQ